MAQIKKALNSSEIDSKRLETREYQIAIAEECVDKNSLVVLPTGLGKTIIAVLVAEKILKRFPSNSKIIVIAPTRPLINQHYQTFLKFLNISTEKFAILTGKILPEHRTDIFTHHQLLFYTPQTLRNDLVNQKYTLDTTALLVVDECHHATGDYPYIMIADKFTDHNPDGIILGLTASPGASKKKISILCQNLHIPMDNIHIRTRRDSDVKTYLKPMDIFKIGVDLTPLMEEVYYVLTMALEERLHYLSQLNFLKHTEDALHTKVFRKDLLKLNSELVGFLKIDGDKTRVYSALSINAQGLILFHMLELVEQQGLNVLLVYLNKLHIDAKKKTSSKATKILASDGLLNRIHLELKKNAENSPENLVHPKYHVLEKIILEELQTNPESRILVFIKLRNSVINIVKKLKNRPSIHPTRFVGHITKSEYDKGLSQTQQIEILEQFKEGKYNVLCSTNVGEEGLDISECDLVIFYDVVASEIRLIQRKGRTARHRKGKVVILYSKNTRDEIYLNIALSKLKRMNINLRNPRQLYDSYKKEDIEIVSVFQHENVSESVPIAENVPRKQAHIKIIQSKLSQFVENSSQEYSMEKQYPITLSKFLPMKFGIRNRLQSDHISYGIQDSKHHIIIHNEILIQIYNLEDFNPKMLLSNIKDFRQISSLVIIIFDFTSFSESIEGEKRIKKEKLHEFTKKHAIKAIAIDNEEELYFIIKNILEKPYKEK